MYIFPFGAADESAIKSADYATAAWSNLIDSYVMRAAGKDLLELVRSSPGGVTASDIAGIAEKWRMTPDQFARLMKHVMQSNALEAAAWEGRLNKAAYEKESILAPIQTEAARTQLDIAKGNLELQREFGKRERAADVELKEQEVGIKKKYGERATVADILYREALARSAAQRPTEGGSTESLSPVDKAYLEAVSEVHKAYARGELSDEALQRKLYMIGVIFGKVAPKPQVTKPAPQPTRKPQPEASIRKPYSPLDVYK